MATFYKKSTPAVHQAGLGQAARLRYDRAVSILSTIQDLLMQQTPKGAPPTGFTLVLAVVLGVFSVINLVGGLTGEGLGVFLKGLAMTIYAVVLLRDALHIKKTGQPSMTRARMNTIGLACLALYLLGVLVQRGPEMAQFLA
jgi:hypothetical protein